MVFDMNDTESEFPVAAPLPMSPFLNEKGEEIALCMILKFRNLIIRSETLAIFFTKFHR
jgi:hypothetical protein